MSFDEVRLPDDVERGARGGPSFRTSVAELDNGFEQRNGEWTRERNRWNIGFGIQNEEGFTEVMTFFRARHGRLYGFRFKDWADFRLSTGLIGVGDNSTTQFQIIKQYTSGPRTYERALQKIVSGTVQVLVNSVIQTETTHYTVDLNTGVITFVSAPGNLENVEVSCEFDIPVRFEQDDIELNLEYVNAGGVPNVPIIEILQELALG